MPIAVGGSSVRDWAGPDGPSQRAVRANEVLGRIGLHVTHVLWHQGEADYEMHKEVYARLFARMTDYIRANGINAPVFVATATVCNNTGASQIREAQRELPFRLANVFAGPDTDALDSIYDRLDNLCHFSDRGLAPARAAVARRDPAPRGAHGQDYGRGDAASVPGPLDDAGRHQDEELRVLHHHRPAPDHIADQRQAGDELRQLAVPVPRARPGRRPASNSWSPR